MNGRQRNLLRSRPLRHMVLAACCTLCFGWFWDVPTLIGSVASAQSDDQNSTSQEAGISRDSTVLARRFLQSRSKELFVDEQLLDRLGREIETVLKVIRDRYPKMGEINARQPPTLLRLEIEGALSDDIVERWTDLGLFAGATSSAGAVLPTGHVAFDDLSARLELRTVNFWPASFVYLEITERANPQVAAEIFSTFDDVIHSWVVWNPIEGSDIAIRNTNGVWHVVMHHAWGDCPSGCINRKTYFFTVKGGWVERIEEEAAQEMEAFQMLKRSLTFMSRFLLYH